VAAGYDAADGGGYAWLLDENQPGWPAYDGQDLTAISGARVMHLAHSGDTSAEVFDAVRDADLPAASGSVVVTISAGGNDFNDDATTMVSADLTRTVAQDLRKNLAAITKHIRAARSTQACAVSASATHRSNRALVQGSSPLAKAASRAGSAGASRASFTKALSLKAPISKQVRA
jgi:lysophospholipase L1-like esterase